MRTESRSPRLLHRIIAACLPAEDERSMLEDIAALYANRRERFGRWRADAWLTRQATGFVAHVALGRLGEFVVGGDGLRVELRASARSLLRQPAFSLPFIITLAAGIGVLSTVYATARWLVLRPVPGVSAPEALQTLRLSMDGAPPYVVFDISDPDVRVLRERLPIQGALAAWRAIDVDLSRRGAVSRRIGGEMVSANYLAVLGARLIAGRGFVASEDREHSGVPFAIVSAELAHSIAASPAEAVGADIHINGSLVRVVGVTTPEFRGAELPGRAQIWMPLSALAVIDPSSLPGAAANRAAGVWKNLIARTSLPTAVLEREANAVVKAVRAEKLPSSYMMPQHRYAASAGIGLDPAVRATVRRTLSLLGASSILLLLLAIANLANLTLVRSTVTSTATAIRFALGATRARVARAVFVDAVVLGAAGCAGALLLATLWSRWYRSTQLDEHGAALQGLQLDWRVMVVSLGAAVLASTVAFLKPAFGARFRGLERQLRSGTNAPGGSRLRMTLVAVQVALSVLLLVGAGLLGRTVSNLRSIDLGFNPDRVLTLSMDPHLHGIEGSRLTDFATRFEEQVSRVDGVGAAGLISPAPLRSNYFSASMHRGAAEPDPNDASQRPVIGAGYYVSTGFLPAVGARIIAGERAWRADSGTVVLTRSAAAALYPGVDPRSVAGRVFPFGSRKRPVRIAAVIEDLSLSDITQHPPPAIFLPLSRRVAGLSMMAFVSSGRRPERLSAAVQRAAAAVSSDIPVYDVRSAREAVDQQFAARVSMARAASTLGAIGLLLAVSGLYGVLAHLVAARRREFGIRAAMGATPRRILRDVIAGGLAPVWVGLLIGVAGASGASRALRSQLFGLEPNDPTTYGFAVLALLAASLIACAIPALRSSRVSPAEALRD